MRIAFWFGKQDLARKSTASVLREQTFSFG
jgi:hypothetical protein